MRFEVPEKHVFHSWNDCGQILRRGELRPGVILTEDQIQQSLFNQKILVMKYKEAVTKVNDFIEGNYVFTLVDPNGVMLTVDVNQKMPPKVTNYPVLPGVSLAENSCGTNAVALSIKLREPIYLRPEQHFCYFMRDWYGCAVPLNRENQVVGYLCVSSLEQPFSKEMLVIIELLANQIEYGIQTYAPAADTTSLTEQQRQIILLLSQGLPEKAVAGEMNLSVNTIKYHKKNILQQLDAQCTTEAIFKAIKKGIIHVDMVKN